MDRGPLLLRGQRPHGWCPTALRPLPRLLRATLRQQRLLQPPGPEMMHHKKLCTCFFLGLAFSLQEQKMIPQQASAAANVLFSPTGCPSVFKAIWEPLRQGGLLVEPPQQRGNGIREVNSKARLNLSHFRLCSPRTPAMVKRALEGTAHLPTEQS